MILSKTAYSAFVITRATSVSHEVSKESPVVMFAALAEVFS